jgi:hypothetical protein
MKETLAYPELIVNVSMVVPTTPALIKDTNMVLQNALRPRPEDQGPDALGLQTT